MEDGLFILTYVHLVVVNGLKLLIASFSLSGLEYLKEGRMK
jgi:hypothetical protein